MPPCGHVNAPDEQFCGECGAAARRRRRADRTARRAGGRLLAADATRRGTWPRRSWPSRAGLEGERKQVTVLFADVVGSTELIRDRDPEEAQRLLDGAVQVMMDAVHRYEGTVSRLMGDGLMALFGAPVAHEDHAVRACYAALAMQEAVRALRRGDRAERTASTLEIRVGLNSGEVVVRLISDDLHMDYTAMGQTVHLAVADGAARPRQVRRCSRPVPLDLPTACPGALARTDACARRSPSS